MGSSRQPRSKLYDGAPYARLVDPLLDGVHAFVAERLPPGNRVLDACCGTGALSRKLAAAGRRVVGVDLSPRNIEYARRQSESLGSVQPSFEVADVSQLETPEGGRYDVASVVMALHEMAASAREPVLERLLHVAARVMVVDFSVPMPWNLAGVRNRAVEVLAGVEHFSAFRDFGRRGGLPRLFDAVGVEVESERRIDAGTLHVAVLRALP